MSDTVRKVIEFVFAGNEEALKKSAGNADGILKGLDDRLQASAKSFKQSFNLEALAKSGLLVSAAINAIDVASRALVGDIQDAAEAVKKLPLGVGQMATALESVLGKVTGISAEIERLNAQQEINNALIEAGTRSMQQRIRIAAETARYIQDAEDKSRMVGLEGVPRQREGERQRFAGARRDLEDQLKKELEESRKTYNEALRKASKPTISDEQVKAWMEANQSRSSVKLPFGLSAAPDAASGMATPDTAAIRAMLEQREAERLSGMVERNRLKAEEDIKGRFRERMESQERLHQKTLVDIQRKAFGERIETLKAFGKDSVEKARAIFEEMGRNIKDPPKSWARRLYDLIREDKKPAAGRADTADDAGVQARERRLAGRAWAAEAMGTGDPAASWRRPEPDASRPPPPSADQLARQADRTDKLIEKANSLLERIAEQIRAQREGNPAMEGF